MTEIYNKKEYIGMEVKPNAAFDLNNKFIESKFRIRVLEKYMEMILEQK